MVTKKEGVADDGAFNADSKLKLEKAHKAIDRPDQFAGLFVNAARTQKNVSDAIKDVVRELLTSDVKSGDALKQIVRDVENENWRGFLKTTWGRIGVAAWTLLVIIATAFINSKFR